MGVIGRTAEGFVSGLMSSQTSDKRQDSYAAFLSSILAFIFALVILSFVGKLLWNNVMTDLFTCVRPAKSIWHILGLMVFISLVLP
jgi:hypothetical protein